MFDFTPLLLWGRSYLNCNFDVKYWNPYLIGYGPLQINRELNEASNLVPINTGIAVYKNWAQNTNIPIPLHPHAYNLSYWCQKKIYVPDSISWLLCTIPRHWNHKVRKKKGKQFLEKDNKKRWNLWKILKSLLLFIFFSVEIK